MNVLYKTLEQQNFTAATEEDVVRLIMKDHEFMTSFSEHITPQLFREYLRPAVDSCLKYWKLYGKLVPPETLVQDLTNSQGTGFDEDKVAAIIKVTTAISGEPKAPEYTAKMVENFIRMKRIENALGEGVLTLKMVNKEKKYELLDGIATLINQASQPLVYNKPDLFLAEADVRLANRDDIAQGLTQRVGIATGIPGLDKKMPYGGLERGQLGMFLAPTGRGKSIALKHCSYAAALQGLNVVYFSLELPKDMLMDRIDSMVSSVPISRLIELRSDVRKEIEFKSKEMALPNGFGEMAFYELPCNSSVLTIKNELEHFKRRYGLTADVIIVDYMDLMSATRTFKEGAWREQQEVARELRALAVETKTLLWTASQTNRSAINKVEDGKMISDGEAAESYSKQSVADLIVSLNQTAEERKQEHQPKPMKLFIAKNRTGQGGCEIPILTDFSRMCFYAGEQLSLEESALQSGAFVEK